MQVGQDYYNQATKFQEYNYILSKQNQIEKSSNEQEPRKRRKLNSSNIEEAENKQREKQLMDKLRLIC